MPPWRGKLNCYWYSTLTTTPISGDYMVSNSKSKSFLYYHFGPLMTRGGATLAVILCSALAGGITWTDRAVVSQVQRNASLTLFLSVELKRESSADLATARRSQGVMLASTIQEMESPLLQVVGIFNPQYSPVKQLSAAVKVLQQEDLPHAEALLRSQKILAAVGKTWADKDGQVASIWTRDSEQRQRLFSDMLNSFKHNVAEFQKNRNTKTAEAACLSSRLVSRSLLIAWIDCNRSIRQLRALELATHLRNLSLELSALSSTLNTDEGTRVERYSENVGLRADLFQSMYRGDLVTGQKVLLAQLN